MERDPRNLFNKVTKVWADARSADVDNLKQQSDAPPPLTGSLDDVLRAADLAAQAHQKLEVEERRAALLDVFSLRYAEYSAAFDDYRITPGEDKKTILAARYEAFQEATAAVKQDSDVLVFLRSTEFAQYFPKEQGEDTVESDTPELIERQKRKFVLQQNLTTVLVAAATSGDDVSIEQLANEYYPGVDLHIALGRIRTALKLVRRKLELEGYEIINIVPKSELVRGKKSMYHVVKTDTPVEIPQESHTSKKTDEPVRESRLQALSYIITTDDPDIQHVVSLLGKTRGKKRASYDITPWQALTALNRNVKKLYRRVDEGVATDDELRTHKLMEQFLSMNDCTVAEFRTYMKSLFGFTPVEEFTTQESKITYLDAPITDEAPFTRRDAVHLVSALHHYRRAIKSFCGECDLPDTETIYGLYDKLGDTMYMLEREQSSRTSDARVVASRLDAIRHYEEWRARDDFDEVSGHVQEFEFYQVIYNLRMLESAQISINGEVYGGVQFLELLFSNARFRRFVDGEIKTRERHTIETSSDLVQAQNVDGVRVAPVTLSHREETLSGDVSAAQTPGLTLTDASDEEVDGSGGHQRKTRREKKNEKYQEMQSELDAIIVEIGRIPDLGDLCGTAEVTRCFPSLRQTVFDNAVSNKYIAPAKSNKRGGIPLFKKEDIALLLFIEARKGKGGIRTADIKAARKIISNLLSEDE